MDAIADHIWESTIVGLAAAFLAFVFRRNGASVRYWIWFAAAMKFLVPFAAVAAVVDALPLPHANAVTSGAPFSDGAIPTPTSRAQPARPPATRS